MKRLLRLPSLIVYLYVLLPAATTQFASAQNPQQLAFAGLRASGGKGQFNAVKVDPAGNLYLL